MDCCATQAPAKINATVADFTKKGISLILAPVDLERSSLPACFVYPSTVSSGGGPPRLGGPVWRS